MQSASQQDFLEKRAPTEPHQQAAEVRGKKSVIPGQQLISTLSIQQNFDTRCGRKFEHVPLGINTRRTERFILMPRNVINCIEQIFEVWVHVACMHASLLNDDVNILPLVITFYFGTCRKRLLPGSDAIRAKKLISHTHDRR